ncbi:hypothetical protein OIU35_19085 [Boseaceae bacterium BT-24-1]|nr:hypothetical protein [Boseaceae bacterium BT-24-1]
MIDATHLGIAPHGSKPAKKIDGLRYRARRKGSLNAKLRTGCGDAGRPIMLLSEGQMSGQRAQARALLSPAAGP